MLPILTCAATARKPWEFDHKIEIDVEQTAAEAAALVKP
jgi:hypothetical protein